MTIQAGVTYDVIVSEKKTNGEILLLCGKVSEKEFDFVTAWKFDGNNGVRWVHRFDTLAQASRDFAERAFKSAGGGRIFRECMKRNG